MEAQTAGSSLPPIMAHYGPTNDLNTCINYMRRASSHRNFGQIGRRWVYIFIIVPSVSDEKLFKKLNLIPWYSSTCHLFLSPFSSRLNMALRNGSQNSCQLHITMWWCNIISFPWSICAKAETMQICHIYGIMTIFPKQSNFLLLVLGSKSLLHLSSSTSLTSWLVGWAWGRAARNYSRSESFIPKLHHISFCLQREKMAVT